MLSKRVYGCLEHRDVIKYYFRFLAMCDDVQLCNRCVREFLILARTWFAFGLPSETGCDNRPTCHQPPKGDIPPSGAREILSGE
jgi:hypothetical protein